MAKILASITCVGGYVPEDKLTNLDLENWWTPMTNGLHHALA